MNVFSLFPDLSNVIRSLIPSKFKSISLNCIEFIPPTHGDLNLVLLS